MGLALYRKYRSKSLDEIVGQSHITDMLRRSLEMGNVAHAYLLTGPKGVGKTSIARILAHEINKLPYSDESTHLDIIEIDAASNNSVEDIRDLRERVQIMPVSATKKVYIIDEVHMLSKSAFNALLKTLEEPPEHVVFILATTDVEKLPATIVSRTQRFNFRMISVDDAVEHLEKIAKAEHIAADKDALHLIAEQSGGSFRDSISMLDQLQHASDGSITKETVERVMGLAPSDRIEELLAAHQSQGTATVVNILNQFERQGTAASTLIRQLISTINTRVIDHPELLVLLDKLLDSSRSAWPYVKLLTALARSPSVSVIAVQPQEAAPATPAPKASKPVMKQVEDRSGAPTPSAPKVALDTQVFPWEDFLTLVKDKTPGTYSLLQKCAYTYDGSTLTIYAGKKFQKNQIDKSHTILGQALADIAPGAKELTVIPSPKPSTDSQTAAIIGIMGGGEEVSL